MNKHRTIVLIASVIIFGLSLPMETFLVANQGESDGWSGGFVNLILGLFGGNISWFANLAIIPAWILTKKNSFYPLLLSFIAVLLALSFYFNGSVMVNEAGQMANVTNYLIGYWMWLMSMIVYFVYHLIIYVLEKRNEKAAHNVL